jgi:hypothetical protein
MKILTTLSMAAAMAAGAGAVAGAAAAQSAPGAAPGAASQSMAQATAPTQSVPDATAPAPAAGDTTAVPDQVQAPTPAATVVAHTVTNGPIPDTPANRAKYGGPMSHTGKRTQPAGN